MIELLNEFILLVFGYSLVLSTDYVPEVELQYQYGWYGVRMVSIVMLCDLIYMIVATLHDAFFTKKH